MRNHIKLLYSDLDIDVISYLGNRPAKISIAFLFESRIYTLSLRRFQLNALKIVKKMYCL